MVTCMYYCAFHFMTNFSLTITYLFCNSLYKTKNGKNFLNMNDNGYTETDIVVKAVGYIVDGLVPDFTFSEKW